MRSVRTYWPQAKYFLVRPSHSVNNFIFWPYHFDVYGPYKGTFCLWFSMEMARGIRVIIEITQWKMRAYDFYDFYSRVF